MQPWLELCLHLPACLLVDVAYVHRAPDLPRILLLLRPPRPARLLLRRGRPRRLQQLECRRGGQRPAGGLRIRLPGRHRPKGKAAAAAQRDARVEQLLLLRQQRAVQGRRVAAMEAEAEPLKAVQ